MARGRWVMRDGKLVPSHLAEPLTPKGPASGLPKPYVIGDVCPPTRHMSTGQVFESKSQFRDVTRRLGLTEIGNDSFPERRDIPVAGPTIAEDIRMAYDELASAKK